MPLSAVSFDNSVRRCTKHRKMPGFTSEEQCMFGHSAKRVEPGPGQESVWDYPRPPRLEPSPRHIEIVFGGITVADTRQAWRVLETSHPPVYYIPPVTF